MSESAKTRSELTAFRDAIRGIKASLRRERHLRFQLLAAAIVLIAGVLCALTAIEWVLIIVCIMSVLTTELINAAIEAAVDIASPGHHEVAGFAKDAAAGAVLISSLGAAVIGMIIFGSRLF